ncbi:MAG TPA: hypothetical protein VFV28_00915, partial [Limnobacter sp.]|nr:hypothetical protein [Limnobacter sp.]
LGVLNLTLEADLNPVIEAAAGLVDQVGDSTMTIVDALTGQSPPDQETPPFGDSIDDFGAAVAESLGRAGEGEGEFGLVTATDIIAGALVTATTEIAAGTEGFAEVIAEGSNTLQEQLMGEGEGSPIPLPEGGEEMLVMAIDGGFADLTDAYNQVASQLTGQLPEDIRDMAIEPVSGGVVTVLETASSGLVDAISGESSSPVETDGSAIEIDTGLPVGQEQFNDLTSDLTSAITSGGSTSGLTALINPLTSGL